MSVLALALAAYSVPCAGGGPGCNVKATVGRARMVLKVDTGADLTVLSADAARRAGIRPDPDAPTINIRGVNGVSRAQLAHVEVDVGGFEEDGVLVAVMPELELGGGAQGLLGMTYLERFDTQLGAALELTPIDAHDSEKKGGRGRSWWSLRFRQVDARARAYRSAVADAQQIDRRMEATYGEAANGGSVEDFVKRLSKFMDEAQRKLQNKAARYAVPRSWRQ